MKIIIEGCDGTGKTTIAKKLAKKYKCDVIHMTSKDPKDFNFYSQSLRKTNAIYDRNFLSEMIYPKVFKRNGSALTEQEFKLLLKQARDEDILIVILTASRYDISTRLNERVNEPEEILKKYVWIDKQYRKMAEKYRLFLIDTSYITPGDVCKFINDDISYRGYKV